MVTLGYDKNRGTYCLGNGRNAYWHIPEKRWVNWFGGGFDMAKIWTKDKYKLLKSAGLDEKDCILNEKNCFLKDENLFVFPQPSGYFVLNMSHNGRAPTYLHTTKESAVDEAHRLAKLNPGVDFSVVELLENYRAESIVHKVASSVEIPF